MTINYRDGIAIGEIVVYLPALAIAIVLAIRHGFGRSSGWFFLVLFALIRIIGACFQLATINDPTNASLFIGVSILQSIGLSPLELTALGLLSRVISSINRNQPTLVKPVHMKLIQLIVTVGLILGIVGGINASDQLAKTGVYQPQTLSKASVALFIASYVGVVIATILVGFSVSHAETGEKRLLLAVAISLPFFAVRVVYSAVSIFANTPSFNSLSGNVTIFLCMALLMELAIVIIYEGVGITLRKIESHEVPHAVGEPMGNGTYAPSPNKATPAGRGRQIASTLGRHTIIGRLITSGGGRNKAYDSVEMQPSQGGHHARREERRAQRHGV